jgi:hypothetical protein
VRRDEVEDKRYLEGKRRDGKGRKRKKGVGSDDEVRRRIDGRK